MKKSIFKKLMSFVATVAILATSTVVAMADYECASQSTDCSVDTWKYSKSADLPGTSMGITADGMLKVERSIFKTSTSECASYGLTAVTEGENKNVNGSEMWFKASEDGTKWESIPNPPNWGSTPNQYADWSFADDASFSKGTVQAKFDFKFEGDSRQCISVGFLGSTSVSSRVVGMRIYREQVRFWLPTDLTSNPVYYNQAKTNLPLDTWYTVTMSYNMDTKLMTYTMESRDDESFSISLTHSYDVANYWSSDVSPAAIKGIRFADYRGINNPVLSTTPDPANVVWYIDNVELDAGVGYKAENRYSTGDGMISNAPGAGMDFDGIKLDRLTRIADPANAKFITAAYDADGRMTTAVATPLSEVGTEPVNADITGATIKSFVFGMDNAMPYMAPYSYTTPEKTVRAIDFDGDYPESIKTMSSLKTEFTHGKSSARGLNMSIVSENGNNVLKSERTNFRVTGTTNKLGNVYYWYNPATKAFEMAKGESDTGYYYIDLGKPVTDLSGSFRFKFAGSNYETTYQEIEFNINAGPTSGSVSEYFIRISRDETGAGGIRSGFGGNTTSWTNMNAGEWYTCNFTCKDGKLTATVTGRFGNSSEITTTTAKPQDLYKTDAFQRIGVGSHRDQDKVIGYSKVGSDDLLTDYVVKEAAKEGENNTSVWYIDDIKFEY